MAFSALTSDKGFTASGLDWGAEGEEAALTMLYPWGWMLPFYAFHIPLEENLV